MPTVKDPASIISESIMLNNSHRLSDPEKVDTFDQSGGQHSIANIKFAAQESPWQKALLNQDFENAHRIIRGAMNLAEPATKETKHEMAKQFFRQFNHLLGSTTKTDLKEKIQAVGDALKIDPDLRRAKEDVDAEQTVSGRTSPEPATEAAEFSSRSDSFKTSPERGQSPVRDPETEKYLSVDVGVSKYSPFVNAVLGATDTAKEIWAGIEHDSESIAKAAQQLATVLPELTGGDQEVLEHYGISIARVDVRLWQDVKKRLARKS